ncbi:MAG: Hsp70 family protein [Deltaproteobacteria bacterium]|nr:Hsp70 family protein [Deltaproteobacteria bacterium]
MSELVFGIDFGTTYSTVAVCEGGGAARVVEGAGGDRVTPSVVYYAQDGSRVVGEHAISRGVLEPDRTITGIKRLIGRAFDTRVVQDFAKTIPYAIEPDDQRYCVVRVGDRRHPPGEIATAIFSELRDRAKAATGASVITAVITAPAHFGAAERRGIHAAATRAEIDVLRVLTEPTAASVAYGARAKAGERVLIFDLGGGTLDVTVLRIDEDVHEILAVGGHPLLGGLDFDNALCEELESQILVQTGLNVRDQPVAHRRLLLTTEQIKRELSDVAHVDRTLPQLLEGKDVRLTYTRAALEMRISRLVDRAIEIAQNVLRDSGIHKQELDRLLLVGGSTRVPLVRRRLEEEFGKILSHAVHPQEAVALGAAQFAATLGTSRAMRLLDVLPASVGIADSQGRMISLIKRNSTLPCEGSFEIEFGGQESRQLVVFQGEQEFVDDNEAIGMVNLLVDNDPVERALVTVRADGEGMVTVSAFDAAKGRVLRTQFSLRVAQRLSAWAR